MTAYYSENDPAAAAVLRLFIDEGIIAPGYVDSRSIEEVTADDIRGFTQCHWFAGAGMWSIAARMAGWPDRRPLWTASCPCQPWSAAGQQLGVDDPRHLWPHLFRILSAYRRAGYAVPVIVGEQVAGAAGYHWFDGVRADLAREEIPARTVDVPACAVDSPQQRNRLWWVGVASAQGGSGSSGLRQDRTQRHGALFADGDGGNGLLASGEGQRGGGDFAERGPQGRTFDEDGAVVDASRERRGEGRAESRIFGGRTAAPGPDLRERGQGDVGGPVGAGLQGFGGDGDGRTGRPQSNRSAPAPDDGDRNQTMASPFGFGFERGGEPQRSQFQGASGSVAFGHDAYRVQHRPNGTFWSDAEWIICHDEKARRAQPGIRMLVDGMAGRIDLWRLSGNSIVPWLAAEVIAAILDAEAEITSNII